MLYLCSEAFFVKDTHERLNIAVCYNIILFMMVYKLLMDLRARRQVTLAMPR